MSQIDPMMQLMQMAAPSRQDTSRMGAFGRTGWAVLAMLRSVGQAKKQKAMETVRTHFDLYRLAGDPAGVQAIRDIQPGSELEKAFLTGLNITPEQLAMAKNAKIYTEPIRKAWQNQQFMEYVDSLPEEKKIPILNAMEAGIGIADSWLLAYPEYMTPAMQQEHKLAPSPDALLAASVEQQALMQRNQEFQMSHNLMERKFTYEMKIGNAMAALEALQQSTNLVVQAAQGYTNPAVLNAVDAAVQSSAVLADMLNQPDIALVLKGVDVSQLTGAENARLAIRNAELSLAREVHNANLRKINYEIWGMQLALAENMMNFGKGGRFSTVQLATAAENLQGMYSSRLQGIDARIAAARSVPIHQDPEDAESPVIGWGAINPDTGMAYTNEQGHPLLVTTPAEMRQWETEKKQVLDLMNISSPSMGAPGPVVMSNDLVTRKVLSFARSDEFKSASPAEQRAAINAFVETIQAQGGDPTVARAAFTRAAKEVTLDISDLVRKSHPVPYYIMDQLEPAAEKAKDILRRVRVQF